MGSSNVLKEVLAAGWTTGGKSTEGKMQGSGREDVLGERANVLCLLVAPADVVVVEGHAAPPQPRLQREIFIDNLLVRIHFIIVMISHHGSLNSLSHDRSTPTRTTMTSRGSASS